MREVHAYDPFKLWSYWTEVHQIYMDCSKIIADELLKIRMVIFRTISEYQSDE